MSPRLSDQGRHTGDADRRGHHRALTPRAEADEEAGIKILLIRLRLIGDVVFTTPAITALRRRFPDADITYLVEPPAEPVVRHNPHLDHVVVAERPRGLRRLRYDLGLAAALRRPGFDVVIDFHGGPRSAYLTRATGAAMRIGYALPYRRWAYTHRLAWTPSLVPPVHSVRNQYALLQPLGVAPPAPGEPPVEMVEDAAAVTSSQQRLRSAGLPAGSPLVVIHVSASSPFRRWPRESFAHVAARLIRSRPDVRVVFTAGPSERKLQEDVIAEARQVAAPHAARILLCGDFDLAELRAVVGRAALYIGGDSGPLHIAATTRTPIVALFGPTLPARSMPWRDPRLPTIAIDAGPLPCRPCDQRQCQPGDFRCLTHIGVDQVAGAALTLLGAPR